MILYRLVQDFGDMPEGACISLEKFNRVYFLDKALFEPISDFEIPDLIEYKDEKYCGDLGIEKILFYSEFELQKFIEKGIDNGFAG